MKHLFKLLVVIGLCMTYSCDDSNDESGTDNPANLVINTSVRDLMSKTSSNDGSSDNILDQANCVEIQLPVDIIVDGMTMTITTEDDLDDIEDIYDEFDDDIDELDFVFPITIILSDHSTVVVNNDAELAPYIDDCEDENEDDDDIECVDFVYPISLSILDSNDTIINTITITNDQELYDFVDDIDQYDQVAINYPIDLVLYDGTTVTATNDDELETILENAEDSCDEDDDYDYDDDDDNDLANYDVASITSALASCSCIEVDEFEFNTMDISSSYDDYCLNFDANGTITLTDDAQNPTTGTYTITDNNGVFELQITIAGNTELSGTWTILELEEDAGEIEIELENANGDELELEGDC